MAALNLSVKSLVNPLIVAAFVALAVGVTQPILTINKLIWISNTFSLLSGTIELLQQGQILLCFIIFFFSILLPAGKLILLVAIWNHATPGANSDQWLRWMAVLGKWSMLDVFVVAILIASVKIRALVNVEIHLGLYAFALAVVLTIVSSHLVQRWR